MNPFKFSKSMYPSVTSLFISPLFGKHKLQSSQCMHSTWKAHAFFDFIVANLEGPSHRHA